jgi:hypothetical protein
MPDHTKQTEERYEVRLVKIDAGNESVVESKEIPLEKLREQSQQVSELPNREAMSLINANIAAPINLAAALNVLSDSSVAVANAQQVAPITQST